MVLEVLYVQGDVPVSQASAIAARDAIARMLQVSVRLPEMYSSGRLLPQPVDIMPMIIETMALQARAIALLLDEVMVLNGQSRAIQFKDSQKSNGESISLVTQ